MSPDTFRCDPIYSQLTCWLGSTVHDATEEDPIWQRVQLHLTLQLASSETLGQSDELGQGFWPEQGRRDIMGRVHYKRIKPELKQIAATELDWFWIVADAIWRRYSTFHQCVVTNRKPSKYSQFMVPPWKRTHITETGFWCNCITTITSPEDDAQRTGHMKVLKFSFIL